LSDVISEKTYHVHHKNYSTRSESVLQYNPAQAGGLDAGESIVGGNPMWSPTLHSFGDGALPWAGT